MNEAAIYSARKDMEVITFTEVDEAIDRVICAVFKTQRRVAR